MTAQLVVMNTGGIALASDSAVTIRGVKVYNSANKLFQLSEKHTIGVMIYGTSTMFHVPWETLMKVYSNTLDRPFNTVKEYVEQFLEFLNDNPYDEFMDEINEERYLEHSLYGKINDLYNDLSDMNKNLYSELGELRLQDEIQEMYALKAEAFLHEQVQQLRDKDYPVGFDHSDYEKLFDKYGKRVEELLNEQFESHLLLDEWHADITSIIMLSLLKAFSNDFSGIVFAGFGKEEIYPSAYVAVIDGKVNNKTKHFIRKRKINHSTHGIILPFAQRDMIRSFLDGIHEDMERFISAFFKNELHHITDTFMDQIKDHLKEDVNTETVGAEISHSIKDIYSRYQKEVVDYKRKNFIDPILDVVDALPVTELAHLSESLLNVASLKRKISISTETVGGPIDVAVITKGDGFSWVKKKNRNTDV